MQKMTLKQRLGLDLFSGVIREEAGLHPLRQIFWECTLRCNLRCRHCGSDCRVLSEVPDMKFEDFEKVLLRVREAYDPHHINIVVTGGEPLMRLDLVSCGRRIQELEFPWGMVSNGRLLSDSKIDSLLAAGMRSATISLDGLEEVHDWMRGVPGTYSTAVKAIGRLAAEPDFGFDVVSCITARSYPQLSALKELLISLGVRSWRLFTVFPVGRAASDKELFLTQEQYRGLMDFIAATRAEGRIKASYACEGFLGPYEGKVRDNLYSCQAGLSVAGVRIDGAISACTSIRARFDQGNIYRDDFVDVWEKGFSSMRERSWARTGECADCRYWKWCLGGGMHLRDDEGKLIQCNLDRLGLRRK